MPDTNFRHTLQANSQLSNYPQANGLIVPFPILQFDIAVTRITAMLDPANANTTDMSFAVPYACVPPGVPAFGNPSSDFASQYYEDMMVTANSYDTRANGATLTHGRQVGVLCPQSAYVIPKGWQGVLVFTPPDTNHKVTQIVATLVYTPLSTG